MYSWMPQAEMEEMEATVARVLAEQLVQALGLQLAPVMEQEPEQVQPQPQCLPLEPQQEQPPAR